MLVKDTPMTRPAIVLAGFLLLGTIAQAEEAPVAFPYTVTEKTRYQDNTLILFTSDNGAEPDGEGRQNGHFSNGDLRGQKRSILEGGHRVPLLAGWPEKIKAGSVSNSLVYLSDMMATFAALTGYELTDDAGEDSFNAWPAFLGSEEMVRESIIHQDIIGPLGIRNGKWKYVVAARKTKLDPGDKEAVFNMEVDWRETANVAATHPEILQDLRVLLQKQKKDGRTATHRAD